ncbi:ATP-binding protein [Clostridium chauvoei]|uniref:histidine kinase n=5 Tax=Clostridium chauvoei TaxID=46867 RepID=A0A1U6JR13_9CLOT|nr:ATP-binding protein [Clostridium chauvoei]ATD54075.1 histidine kinase [Clostridium chauvoei]ATD58474.1 histidine kinase [Clostridium chauvoei]MBX7281294.1 GHKL domain-containing protein [Clostridium chauvoei]MBX7283800.1 GHKL domain-containing protein [Clostridium chauvoei]MBX7286383.1 GHKL domain-containing protein [Clostridium chauvoei]
MKFKLSFKQQNMILATIIALIQVMILQTLFVEDKINTLNKNIKSDLHTSAVFISKTPFIKEKLKNRENDYTIQSFTKELIEENENIDIIVVADITGEKYSHLDESQIGDIFKNPDKKDVLEKGISYYSSMTGSMGKTLRYFEPIFYGNEQVGFVMVGKYQTEIEGLMKNIIGVFTILFIVSLIINIVLANWFAKKIKNKIFGMEPEEIARLYTQKEIILNNIKEGIIALDNKDKIIEVNNACYHLLKDFNEEKFFEKISSYIEKREVIEIKEFIIDGEKIFLSIYPMIGAQGYLGSIITIIDRNEINKVAKEITGVDEIIRNLRATVHEFKNKLHVILGLIKIEEYDEARKYIINTQESHELVDGKFISIEDNYIKGLLISRQLVANERNISFEIDNESNLYENHGQIEPYDLITIIGNLLENAFEACLSSRREDMKVEISIKEDSEKIFIKVKDNGIPINKDIKSTLFVQGVSSKGNGRGFGLALIKSRVELYSGNIQIDEVEDTKIFIIEMNKGGSNEKSNDN